MVVGAAGYHAHIVLVQRLFQRLGVADNLALILHKVGLQRLMETDGLGRDDVHQRAALDAGEDGLVDGLGMLFLAEDEAAAWAAQGLVGGAGDHIGVGHGVGVAAGGRQARDVRHIHHQVRIHHVGDLAEALKVDDAGIGRRAGHDHARAVLAGQSLHLVIVDGLSLGVEAVAGKFEILARDVERAAVGEVAAVVEAHAQHPVAGLEQGIVCGHVGL